MGIGDLFPTGFLSSVVARWHVRHERHERALKQRPARKRVRRQNEVPISQVGAWFGKASVQAERKGIEPQVARKTARGEFEEFPLACGVTEDNFVEWAWPLEYGEVSGRWERALDGTLRSLGHSVNSKALSIMRMFCIQDCLPGYRRLALKKGICNAKEVLSQIAARVDEEDAVRKKRKAEEKRREVYGS